MDTSQFHFQGTFRTYQARVLDSVHTYLDDGRCHIVAPPGSGKTILELELATRFQSPAIVFSPTRAIRTQRIDRFEQYFRTDCGESPL
ncbi:MAG: DEAD/DEAH box helicase family protein [Actinomycetaceae bacterium]|nr:DEAD/DEAH box helicase family protein [Actinomycetaceae bacterium]